MNDPIEKFIHELVDGLPEARVIVLVASHKKCPSTGPMRARTVQCSYCGQDCWWSHATRASLPKGTTATFTCERKKCLKQAKGSSPVVFLPETQRQKEEGRIFQGFRGRN